MLMRVWINETPQYGPGFGENLEKFEPEFEPKFGPKLEPKFRPNIEPPKLLPQFGKNGNQTLVRLSNRKSFRIPIIEGASVSSLQS